MATIIVQVQISMVLRRRHFLMVASTVPDGLGQRPLLRAFLIGLEGVFDVAEELLAGTLLDGRHVRLVDEGLIIVVVGLVDVIGLRLELNLPLGRDVSLLELSRLAVLLRHVVQVLLRRLGELEVWLASLVLLQVQLKLARVNVDLARCVVQFHAEGAHGL